MQKDRRMFSTVFCAFKMSCLGLPPQESNKVCLKRLAVILCGNKRLVLGERGEEAHALRFHVERKVVIPGLLGVERGFDRLHAGVADRSGRQALIEIGVIRAVGGLDELGGHRRLAGLADGVHDRGVELQRHTDVQAVIDDRGDRRALGVVRGLSLDERGDRDHLLERQIHGLRFLPHLVRDAVMEV